MKIPPNLNISTLLSDRNKIVFQCDDIGEGFLYAFYIYLNGEIIEKVPYSTQNKTVFWASLPGEYYAEAYIKGTDGAKRHYLSNSVNYTNKNDLTVERGHHKYNTITNVNYIIKEVWHNIFMIFRLASYDFRLENRDTYLGILWNILTPLIQIGTFWLVFGVGLRQGRDVQDVPYVIWMICGLIPWFFINQGIVKGANSIYSKTIALARMKFPLSVLPLERIIVELYEHVTMIMIMVIMLACFGFFPSFSWLNLVYYIFYTIFFLTSLALITSVLTMLARDFARMIQSLIRLLFYLTPILWDMENMPVLFQKITFYNPIYYVVTGFRDSMLYEIPFWQHTEQLCILWCLNGLLFVLGCNLQVKFKDQFIDLI